MTDIVFWGYKTRQKSNDEINDSRELIYNYVKGVYKSSRELQVKQIWLTIT